MTTVAEAPTTERAITRAPSWVPVAAWGFGLVAVALGAASIVAVQADTLSRVLGVAATVLGLAALAWGAASLLLDRTPTPRGAVAGVFVGMGVAVALLATAPGRASILAVALLLGLGVTVACGIVRGTRHPSRRSSLWGLFGAAAVVTVLVVPALGVCQGAALLDADGTVLPVITHDGH
ncbi:hypothetical protein R8Z57_17105 [Microbacterium sp. M3]|uniref:Uncharacterized protein n=1 Tax=Microbacterium arthrosphaerae TaxID=792652 RepID=A0ABU4H586_9MICO|nr:MULTISPECIES: hypothetical protein [Microbacterium]MDW4574497.1 hypothetical protein [Microbacterium arthrosphaerae]MDW7608352.1 hypothetical protein [Microbacterium sp. M3]